MDWDSIEAAIRPRSSYFAQTGLVAVENTQNHAGGTVMSFERMEEIAERAHEKGLPVHLDGARIFNAAIVLKRDVAEIASLFDSVMFCLSKGLAAPVGSMLVGSAAFIERARSVRKMLGGGMRQAGVLAAAGLIALEKMPARLAEDHRNARLLAELLDGVRGLDLDPTLVRTNILVVGIEGTGMESAALTARLAAEGVLFGTIDPKTIRMLTHLDVSEEQVRHAARAFERVLGCKAAGETAASVS